ncbi:MAG: CHAT domain-containing tetratricopeptide repeat protein [Acidobacteriota bacterium]|nr:CHAT domain-containing tetratricopeptide repeat protein [Acidobacteriota bacterium]
MIPDRPTAHRLAAGESKTFGAELTAGRHWWLRVEQIGIDVVLEVKDPAGKPVLRIDNPIHREGIESLLLTPAITGAYRIEIHPREVGAPPGRFTLRLEELSSEGPLRLRGESAVTEAGRLWAEGGKDGTEAIAARLHEAIDAFRRAGESHREAMTLLTLGGLFEELDDYPQALQYYKRALDLFRALDETSGVAATLDRLGLVHGWIGDNGRAREALEEALALRRRLGRGEAITRNNLCLVLQRSGRFEAAGRCYEEALGLARTGDDPALVANLLNNLGGIEQNLGEPTQAIAYYRQAVALHRANGDTLGEAVTLNNLGFYHHGLGDVEEALLHYAPALELFEERGELYWQARTLNNIGFGYLALGEHERARSYLLRALPLRRTVGDLAGEAVTLRNLGRAAAGLGQPVQAVAFLRRALALSEELGDERGAATARQLMGEVELSLGRTESALHHLELALATQRQMGARLGQAEVLTLLSDAHRKLGDRSRALTAGEQALELHRRIRHPLGEIAALTALARAERDGRRLEAAAGHLETAVGTLEGLRGNLGDPNQRASFLASQRLVYRLYVDTLMALHRRSPAAGHDLQALELSERSRSWSLLALLEAAGAGPAQAAEPELGERLRDARQRFAAKTRQQLRVLGREHSQAEARAAEEELYTALTELDTVRAELRRADPRFDSLNRAEPLKVSEIQELLDEGTVLLEILLGEERSFLWWVTPTAVAVHELPPQQTLEELARKAYRLLADPHRSPAALREALDALGKSLLGPVAQRLRDQRLVIVADGALHLLPFAALTLPSAPGAVGPPQPPQPVISRHEVVNLPSASVLAAQRRELAGAGKGARGAPRVAIFADPVFEGDDPRLSSEGKETSEPSPGALAEGRGREEVGLRSGGRLKIENLERLPHSRREAQAIAAQLPPEAVHLALDTDARREQLLGDQLAGYDILHFATHGFVHPEAPELSGLVLSQVDAGGGEIDGFLGLYDVANLRLSARLVVLSGCGTALGKEVSGEGLVGLPRGFLYAGVPRIVASLWQVRDRATAELMTHFYRSLLVEGASPAAALRSAQLALREERRWRDPFFWAAFTLQGDWR